MKMIQGGRALAAALGGAQAFVRGSDGQWEKATELEVKHWRRVYSANLALTKRFAVRADDARRVLE